MPSNPLKVLIEAVSYSKALLKKAFCQIFFV